MSDVESGMVTLPQDVRSKLEMSVGQLKFAVEHHDLLTQVLAAGHSQGLVQSGEECRVAVHNLVTVSGALDRAGFAIISNSLQHVLRDPDQADAKDNLGELEKLFLSLA